MRSNHFKSSLTALPLLAQHRGRLLGAGATLLVGALVACVAANAQAHTQVTPVMPVAQNQYGQQEIDHAFSLIDTDSNGRLSRSEAIAFRKVANYFDVADSNRDETLSPQEFAAALNGGKSR